ncbi:hypothetical protein Tco_1395218 [Tanacetum coccineum]
MPVPDSVPSSEETEPFDTDKSAATPPSLHTIVEYASTPTPPLPPPSSLTPLSSTLLLIPSPPFTLPSPDRKDAIPEADMPPRKRTCFTAPSHRYDNEESYTRYQDAHDDQALLQAHISTLTKERQYFCFLTVSYEREARYACQTWANSKDMSQAMEAQIKALQRDVIKMAPKKAPMSDANIKAMIAQRVADALAEYEANRGSRNGHDGHDSRSSKRRIVPTTHEWLTQWFEKMKSVFYISNCIVACPYKFATCTLLGSALMWWYSHFKTVDDDAAYGMT